VIKWNKSGQNWIPMSLGAPAGGNYAIAYGIANDSGVVGKAKFTPGGPWRAFWLKPGFIWSSEANLGTLGGSLDSEAWDINDESGIVGWAYNASGRKRAFYMDTADTDGLSSSNELPALPGVTRTDWASEAYGVNRYEWVVGRAQNQSLAWRAFVYKPGLGGMIDLNTLLPPGSGWVLTAAKAINDGGIIVGTGTLNGATKSWIMYPVCQH
jgi:probable HAF family extracellular repeat protein